MSIVNQIVRIKQNISNAYTKLEEKGANLPSLQNSNNLSSSIENIPDNIEKSWWNNRTNNNTEWKYLFYNYSENSLPSGLESNNVYDMTYAFCGSKITSLTSLDFKKVEYAESMIQGNNVITNGVFDMPNLENCENIFSSSSLIEIELKNTSNCTNFRGAFKFCFNLEKIKNLNISGILSDYDASDYNSDIYDAFYSDSNLTDINFIGEIKASIDFSMCEKLKKESILSIINSLAEKPSSNLILGSVNLAKLTDEEKAIATAKGWTLT